MNEQTKLQGADRAAVTILVSTAQSHKSCVAVLLRRVG